MHVKFNVHIENIFISEGCNVPSKLYIVRFESIFLSEFDATGADVTDFGSLMLVDEH